MADSKIRLSNPDRDYASEMTHLRIYKEESGDGYMWHLDGADEVGNYTEEVYRFRTIEKAIKEIPAFIADTTEQGVQWKWRNQR